MTAAARPLLLTVVPDLRLRTAGLIIAMAAFTAAAAQFVIPLPWTPVPITGQTFAVVASGAALGAARGAAAQLLYIAAGAVGMPVFAAATGGWSVATGPTAGYLVGFVAAAFVAGALAERRQDRTLATAMPAMLAATAVVYVFGLPWLAHSLDISAHRAVELGLAPFVIGDVAKATLAGIVAPVAWTAVR